MVWYEENEQGISARCDVYTAVLSLFPGFSQLWKKIWIGFLSRICSKESFSKATRQNLEWRPSLPISNLQCEIVVNIWDVHHMNDVRWQEMIVGGGGSLRQSTICSVGGVCTKWERKWTREKTVSWFAIQEHHTHLVLFPGSCKRCQASTWLASFPGLYHSYRRLQYK